MVSVRTVRACSVLFLAIGSGGASAADPCGAVADDTVAELRAGAGASWNPEVESLVRTAAGAACVKARSGRYGATAALSEEGIAADSAAASATAGEGAQADGSAADADGDEDGFSIGGLKIRGASGSPSKKPYERARDDG